MQSPTGKEHFSACLSPGGKYPSLAAALLWAVAGVATIFVIFLLILGVPITSQILQGRNSTYCCPDVASQLIKAANFSLNACDDYFMHTRYNWHALHDDSAQKFSFSALYVSVTTGHVQSPVGKAISRFYQSCVMTLGQEVDLPTKAMSALLESTGASREMTSTDTLRLLMQLSLLHNLYTPVSLNVRLRHEGTTSALLLHSERRPTSDAWRFWEGKEALLSTFNHRLRVTVENEELLRFENRTASREPNHEQEALNMDLLENLVPNVSKYKWMEMMSSFYVGPSPTVLYYMDIEVIRQDLFFLTADRRERREAQLAFLLVGASVDILDDFYYPELSKKWATLFLYCESQTKNLVSLWRIQMKELTDPVKDDVVGYLFAATKDAVTGDALKLLDPVDFGKARDILSEVHLVRPKDLVPQDIKLPVTGKGLYPDILMIHHFDITVGKSLEAQGVVLYPGLNEHTVAFPFLRANAVVVSALSYNYLRFGNDTDPAINMAVVGVWLSRIFWSLLFNFRDWAMATISRAEEMFTCSRLFTAVDHRSWTFQRLSLKSAVRAASASGPEWHRLLDAWMLKSLSRAQMFYMKYVTAFCDRKKEYYSERVQDLLSSIRDFRDAYGCVSPINASSQCSLDF